MALRLTTTTRDNVSDQSARDMNNLTHRKRTGSASFLHHTVKLPALRKRRFVPSTLLIESLLDFSPDLVPLGLRQNSKLEEDERGHDRADFVKVSVRRSKVNGNTCVVWMDAKLRNKRRPAIRTGFASSSDGAARMRNSVMIG
jgi:hypothetical protein